jgi:hypothetical protein
VPLNECLPTTQINTSEQCLSQAQKNLTSVLSDDSVTTVIIGTTWYSDVYISLNGTIVGRDRLKHAFDHLIKLIEDSGKRAILLSPIAIPGENNASALSRKLKFKQITEAEVLIKIRTERKTFDENFANINEHFKAVMGQYFIEVYNDLCDKLFCYYGTSEGFYFSDESHLSAYAMHKLEHSRKQIKNVLEILADNN